MTCTKPNLDRQEARAAVHAMRSKHPRSHDYRVYRCDGCNAWHVGRRSKR